MMVQTFPLVEVSGSAYELGFQHGAQAAPLVERYLRWIEKLAGKPRDLLGRNSLAFLPAIQALSPAYVEEIRGLAAGANISFEEALLCQVRGEAARIGEGGCTAFALTGSATVDGRPLAGQNQDLEPEFAEVAIMLRIKPTDGRPRALIFTFAGQLGYAGMNESGLALFNNALFDYTWQQGLPRQPLKRVLLEKGGVAQCVELLSRHRTCSAANVLLADGQGRIASIEIRPEGIAPFEEDQPDYCLHTNHYLTAQFAQFETNSIPDSGPRLARLRTLIQKNWGRITVDTLKDILADHADSTAGICRHGATGWHSISGYIAEPAKRLLHVRRGHGCLGIWQAYEV
jgi:isopenicillin-N N-acyltransferase-like protein